MKKIIILLLMFAGVQTVFAQTGTPKTEMTKAEKDAAKAKKEADQAAAFKELQLTDTQITKIKEVLAEAGKKGSALRDHKALSDAEKEAARKLINDEKNEQIKTVMGEEKYRQYNAIKKRQKEEAEAAKTQN
jgi:hypothetical protein